MFDQEPRAGAGRGRRRRRRGCGGARCECVSARVGRRRIEDGARRRDSPLCAGRRGDAGAGAGAGVAGCARCAAPGGSRPVSERAGSGRMSVRDPYYDAASLRAARVRVSSACVCPARACVQRVRVSSACVCPARACVQRMRVSCACVRRACALVLSGRPPPARLVRGGGTLSFAALTLVCRVRRS